MDLKELIGTSKLNNTVELYYTCLLGKYLKENNVTLSLKDVDVSSLTEHIEDSIYYVFFKFAVENRYITDLSIELPVSDEDDLIFLNNFLFMDSYEQVEPNFYEVAGNDFFIEFMSGRSPNSRLFKQNIEESAAIDLTAYFHVKGVLEQSEYRLHPKLSTTVRNSSLGVPSLYYLSNSEITNGVCEFRTYNSNDAIRLGYDSWYFLGLEQGYLASNGFSMDNKRELLTKKEYQVGNVVFLYERASNSTSRKLKLSNSQFAIVREITHDSITLETVPTAQTRLDKQKQHESYSVSVQELYKHDDLDVYTRLERFSLASIGVEYLMSDGQYGFENSFITPVSTRGIISLWVEQDGFEVEQEMSVPDAVFWVLKDWGIEFNETAYIETYYKDGNEPLYYQEIVDDFGYSYL